MSVDLQATVQVNETAIRATVGVAPGDVTPIGQAEAEGGTAETPRVWSSLRVRQAIVAWWQSISSAFGRSFVAAANAAAGRTALGLGTAAITDADAYATAAQGTTADAALPANDTRVGGIAQTLTVTANAATIDLARPNEVYLLTIGSAPFTLNVNNLPADPGWASAEIVILPSSVPASFTFAGTGTKVDVPGSTLADNPFRSGVRTRLRLKKLAAGVYSAEFERTARRYSDNSGVIWTARTAAAANDWTSIKWAGSLGLYCAVASSGTGNRVMTSPNGKSWTSRVSAANDAWTAIEWSPQLGLLCAVSSSGTVMTSPNAVTWTLRTASFAGNFQDIAWSPSLGLFCAIAFNDNRVMTSPNGETWTTRTMPGGGSQWTSITWASGLGLFCAVSLFGGDLVATSPDTITWTRRAAGAGNEWRSVAWSTSLSLLCAVGSNGTNRAMTSPDSVSWTVRTPVAQAGLPDFFSIAASDELSMFVALASTTGDPRVQGTENGIDWSLRHTPFNRNWRDVCWSSDLGQWVGVGIGGAVMSSP